MSPKKHDDSAAPTPEEWRARVEAELGPGKDFGRSLVTRTLEGLDVEPLYWAAAQEPSFSLGSSGWAIAPLVDHPSPKAGNEELLEDLAQGATGCVIGLSRSAKGLGESGAEASEQRGVEVHDLVDLEKLLDGVYLDAIPIVFESSGNGLPLGATVMALCKERAVDMAEVEVFLGMDPVGALARDGALPGDMQDAKAELCKLGSYSRLHWHKARSVAVDAGVWHRAGAHGAQELGFALATFVEYLRWLEESGLAPSEAYSEFEWRFDVGRDVFGEIAKLRAARELYGRVLGTMGIGEAAPLVISATTSPRSYSCRDPWTNMLRTSLGVFAASTGGADIVTALPYDSALGLGSPLGRRNARNTQLVLQRESRLDHVGDPTRGSYFVEARTQELCEAAWNVFLAVEEEGGMCAALDSDWVAGEIDRSRSALREELATRRRAVIGVSEYPGAWLEDSAARRSEHAAAIALARRESAARLGTRGNVVLGAIDELPHAREAAAGAATLQEIGGALVRGAPSTMNPMDLFREASVFEDLVGAVQDLGRPPRVFLACLGPLASYAARSAFATNLFRAGGFDVIESAPDLGPTELARDLKECGAQIACLVGSDDAYGEVDTMDTMAQLRSAGADAVWVAGKAGPPTEDLKGAGLDGHVFLGCNAAEILRSLIGLVGPETPKVSL